MIKEIEICNVKVFNGEGWTFSFPNLTLLCGSNNSGKSSLLKTILLLSQTFSPHQSLTSLPGRLRFSGPVVELGGFKDFASNHDLSANVSISITIEDTLTANQYRKLCKLSGVEVEKFDSQKVSYELSCEFHFVHSIPQGEPETAKEDEQSQNSKRILSRSTALLSLATFHVVIFGKSILPIKVSLAPRSSIGDEPRYYLELPKIYFANSGLEEIIDTRKSESATGVKIQTKLAGIIPWTLVAPIKPKSTNSISKARALPLPPELERLFSDLRRALLHIHYVPPDRLPPRRYYIAPLEASVEEEASLDFLPHLLREEGRKKVRNWRLSKSNPTDESLLNALNYWLFYFRTGNEPKGRTPSEIKMNLSKGVLAELSISNPLGNGLYNLIDSGYGYSQIIPIIIRCLTSGPFCTTIIEQPELHLNPALQVRMGTFLASMATTGRQIIIETHSEHIVNTIRVITAENSMNGLNEKCIIYYLDSSENPISIKRLEIQPNGMVPDWPINFFGEAASLTGRLMRAQKSHFEQASK